MCEIAKASRNHLLGTMDLKHGIRGLGFRV